MKKDLFNTKKDVMDIMRVAPETVYRVIKELNEELQAKCCLDRSNRVNLECFIK